MENFKIEMNGELATIYTVEAFGARKTEVKLFAIGRKDYAQYQHCPFVHFVEKGKRKPEGLVLTGRKYLLVLKGHNHPEPLSGFNPRIHHSEDVSSQKTTYGCFDERYTTEFDAYISEYLNAKKPGIIVDVRPTIGTNVINEPVKA